jgi:alpha-tubulin suppressor-like RCC1 family protein
MRPSAIRRTLCNAAVASAAILSAAACGSNEITFDDFDLCPGPEEKVARIRIEPSAINLRVGLTTQIQATPLDTKGAFVLCGPPMVWSTSDASVATVANGLVVGVNAGKAVVRVRAGVTSDSTTVTVVATTIGSISIQRAPASLLVGQTVGLMLLARDTDGNIITPTSVTWSTDNATVATIAPSLAPSTAMLIAVDEGTTTITAAAEGLTTVVRIPITRDAPAVRFRQIAAGFQHTCAIVGGGRFAEGTAFCWGDGTVGQLGINQTGYAATPFPVSGGHLFSFIAVADNSSCAVTTSGETYCWGKNDGGQLGDGTLVDRIAPVRVSTPVAFRSVALGGAFTCGLTSNGAAYCWGQMGGTKLSTPTLVAGGLQFADLTGGGGGFVCGRTTAGRAYCWGTTTYTWAGQAPTAPRGDVLFSQISASRYHVCGVAIADGLGYCWGRLDGRPLGSTIPEGTRDTPVAIPGGLRFTSVAAGDSFTCGVTTSGSSCVGTTYLPNGNKPTPTPIPMEDRHRFVTITGGMTHACAIDVSGGAWCWGRNFEGQVGAGEFNSMAFEPLQLRIQ